MNFIKLTMVLREHKMALFAFGDIKNLFPEEKEKTIKNNLLRWVSKGYIMRLRRGLYELVDKGRVSNIADLYIANRLYEPSYISLETALSIYSIIPDIAAAVTSVTTRPTRTFKNKYGKFFYRSCQKKAFQGYKLMLYEGFKVCIADKEKALVDFLYYRLRSSRNFNFSEERLNKKILRNLDWKKVFRYARYFNNKTVKLLEACKDYAKC
jgi:predicted transcriptional regulator of viral defense system